LLLLLRDLGFKVVSLLFDPTMLFQNSFSNIAFTAS
jgi:hypothetical protein